MSLDNLLKEFFPKQLIPLFLSFLFNEIDIDEINDNNFLILALREIDKGLNGVENKFPNMRDVRIFKDSLKKINECDRLVYYIEKESEYLLKKFFNFDYTCRLSYNCEKYDSHMRETFYELDFDKYELLSYAARHSITTVLDYSMKNKIENFAIKNFQFLDEKTATWFTDIFWWTSNEEYYIKSLESGFLDNDNLERRVNWCIKHKNDAEGWKKAQLTLCRLLKNDILRKTFISTFNISL